VARFIKQRKLLRRAWIVAQNSLNSLLQPLLNIAISLLVVRIASDALWGGFVAVLIGVQIGGQVAAWGSREYLLRAFSRQPDQIRTVWQDALSARLPLLALVSVGWLIAYPAHIIPVLLWGIAAFWWMSFDAVMIYRRWFLFALGVEIISTCLIVSGIVFSGVTVNSLIWLFAIGQSVKAIIYSWRFRDVLKGWEWHTDRTFLRQAWPFFLLGFSGMLGSRIDLYAVSWLRGDVETGQYQVFMNLMLYLQALAQFILLPYLKSVYRLEDSSIYKLARRLFIFGTLILPPVLIGADLLFKQLYDIQYTTEFIILGGLFVLPLYGYLPLIHRLYKRDEQIRVLWANVISAAGNFTLNLILLPRMGITGALLASAVMQWFLLAYYLWISSSITTR
jgi:O-antigen/teichoic acid export membrane protein